jgi:uncharacterized membrane protein
MFVATVVFTLLVSFSSGVFIFVPSSLGLFSLGEPLFFLSALLFGSFVGAFVGGVGFALSNLLLGYPHYVFASLSVNFLAGFVVGGLNRDVRRVNRILGLASSLILVLLFGLVGVTIYSGEVFLGCVKNFFLGERVLMFDGLYAFSVYVSEWFWIINSILIAFYIFLVDFRRNCKYRNASLSLLVGCFIIVFGYFVYETFMLPYLFNIKVSSVANVFTNIGHSVLSATIAYLFSEIVQFKKRVC